MRYGEMFHAHNTYLQCPTSDVKGRTIRQLNRPTTQRRASSAAAVHARDVSTEAEHDLGGGNSAKKWT